MKSKEEEFSFIHAYSKDFPVSMLVNYINSVEENTKRKVSRSGYYKWLKRQGTNRQDRIDEELFLYIKKLFNDHKGTVGRRRIKILLKNEYSLEVCEKRISRLMKKYGLRCKIRQKGFRVRLQPHGMIPNLLKRNFLAVKEKIKFAIDITYLEVKGYQKWIYLCAIKDMYNGEIVAYAVGTNQSMELVHKAFNYLKRKGFAKGALIHSDQGIQFTNRSYIQRVKEMGLTQSMSRRGNCWDNASIESFFGHLKSEMYCFGQPETVQEVTQAVEEYIHYYNNIRVSVNLKNSPVAYRLKGAA
ncbi:IS3 family transposase [Sutcliffiella horikoshii]|uniref:IS3 family transposase n=1 Tax=Sutcliffiella horikoshii TaxID=79883 RepID=UPI00299EF909|nr:IS3 family transposase [Sutcliffiella horikoshii]